MQDNTHISEHQIKAFWKDKRVLITGGTDGLGKNLALFLAENGATVTVVARGKEKIEKLKQLNQKIRTIRADVSSKEAIHQISTQAIGMMGGIDVLINNASYLGPTPLRSLLDTECEDLEAVLQTNLLGPFRLIKVVLPAMILNNSGLLVNISSDAANDAYENWGSYSISKIGLDHLTRIWQAELMQSGVIFLAIDPGDMATSMHFSAIPDADPEKLHQADKVARDLALFLSLPEFEKIRYSASEWRELL